MNVLFDLGHPAHVHVFKNTIWNLIEKDHKIKIAIRERENMVGPLLQHYGLKYEKMHPNIQGIGNKLLTIFNNDLKLLKISKSFNPDMFVSLSMPYSAHTSAIMGKPHIGLADTETLPVGYLKIIVPFTDVILTPDCFLRTLPLKKHIKYPGYHELAYLHPNQFKPNPEVLNLLRLSNDEKYIILRFGAFDAAHDRGIKGFTFKNKLRLVKKLKQYVRVFISSESPLQNSLKKYKINIPPEKIHDAMYYASLLIGDTGTMTTEAACLGTPAIMLHPKVKQLSNFLELEKKYELIFSFESNASHAINKSIKLIQNPNLNKEWQKRRKKLLRDKIDVTKFLVWFIENYPESREKVKENPNYIKKFK